MTLEQIIKQANDNFEKRQSVARRHTSHGHDLALIGNALRQNHEAANLFAIARESQRHHI